MYLTGFIKEYIKSQPIDILKNLSFSLIVPIQEVVLPHYYGKLIDSLSHNKNVVKNIVFVLALFTIIEIGFIISDWHDISSFSKFQTFARTQIVKNIMNQYETEFKDLYVGEIMSKIAKVPYTLVVWYERIKYYIIPYILVFTFGIGYFAYHDKFLGIALMVTAITYIMIILGVPQYFCGSSAAQKDKMINMIHEEIDDTLRNFIAMHGDTEKQKQEIERLTEFETLYTVKFAETMKCLMKTKVYTSFVVLTFICLFISRCYYLLTLKKLTTAKFVSLFLIIIYLCNSMIALEGQLREMVFDWGTITESDELFNTFSTEKWTTSKAVSNTNIPQKQGIGMIDVVFTFPESNHPILKGITFHANKGENIVILGDIGSGKSTILKLLLKFYSPDSGIIYLDGKNINEIPTKILKKRIGYVPQQPFLFNRSVLENIMYGTDNIARIDVENLLNKLNLQKEFENLEDGLDTKVGKNGSRLSGGQRQIVWCVRTLLHNPDILIMDEPTSSLDEKSKQTLRTLLKALMNDKTVFIVTHDKSILDLATRKLYVKDGKIVEGTKQETNFTDNGFVMKGGLLDN